MLKDVSKLATGVSAENPVPDTDAVAKPTRRRFGAELRAATTWAQRWKRVFNIDIETCQACGGALRIIACIDDPAIIEKILTHLDAKTTKADASHRAPPLPRAGWIRRTPRERDRRLGTATPGIVAGGCYGSGACRRQHTGYTAGVHPLRKTRSAAITLPKHASTHG